MIVAQLLSHTTKTLFTSLLATQLLLVGPASAQRLADINRFDYTAGGLADAMCLAERGRLTAEQALDIYKELLTQRDTSYNSVNTDAVVNTAEELTRHSNARCGGYAISNDAVHRIIYKHWHSRNRVTPCVN